MSDPQMKSERDPSSDRDVTADGRSTVGVPPEKGPDGPTATAPVARDAAGREPLLEVDDVTLRFGGVVALDKVNFTLYKGRSSA